MADPLDAVAWPVYTDLLVLHGATPADVEATWAYRRLPEVGRTVQEVLHRSGEWVDGLGYALLAEEWRDHP